MKLLELVPEVGKIVDDLVSTPEEKREAQLRLKELEIRDQEARFGALAAWQGNKSLFVSGSIPAILWTVVFTAVFNYIIAPLLGTFGLTVPVLELPPAYYTLAGSIVWGLLGKKAWDATDLQWGNFEKRPKPPAVEPASSLVPSRTKKIDLNDSEAVDRRLRELAEQYGVSDDGRK
jgi:hypothetical protein